ncbi:MULTISPECIES: class I adenylate-forming enzyme family protein [Streptomyces]|uniref:Class I adenylate-forming enzyme family protein n=1 Tax=Streptomyces eurythermus TaxID=42237 RepID=A0ABW6Z9A4_9ACTN|nr:AMP-binding protein [Streptomyces sp. DSM 40868]QIS68688.1 AMP-binding protein [Streptomyces sp. DSM 40868]
MPELQFLHDLVDTAAERFGSALAIVRGAATMTHRQVAAESRRLAGWLLERGLVRGDRLVLHASTHLSVPSLVYAASRVGVVVAIVHGQVRDHALRHVLTDCMPKLVITSDLAHVAPIAESEGAAAVDFDACATGGDVVCGPVGTEMDACCLIYTSGSTSMPKAVVCTHQQMVFAARAVQAELAYQADDRVFTPLPLSFDYGLYQVFLGALSGAEVHMGHAAEASAGLFAALQRTRATVLASVPSVTETLIRLVRRKSGEALRLRLITNTGAALSEATIADLRAAVPSARLQLMFGLTECKRVSIMPPDGDLLRPGSCGRPLPGTEVVALDDEGRALAPGEVGEFVVRGPHVMAGYWRRPELTEQRFPRRDGLFPELHTGDYGWLDEDGYLYFAGRRDDIYKERGFRVSGTEVEAAARRVAGVDEAVLLAPAAGREHAALFAVTELTPAAVLTAMKGQIEEFKIPARCIVLERLPLTQHGKPDRKVLAARLVPAPSGGDRAS